MYATVGDIFPFAGTFLPAGLLYCDGQTVSSTKWPALASFLHATYGGDDFTTVGLPNIPPIVTDDGKKIRYVIVADGTPFGNGMYGVMGEVKPFALPPPDGSPLAKNWIPCSCQTLNMTDSNALLSLLNPNYPSPTYTLPTLPPVDGGNGRTLSYYLCVQGEYPIISCDATQYPSDGFSYERLMGSLMRVIWKASSTSRACALMLCQGQVLSVSTGAALGTILRDQFGGNGNNTYALPTITPRSPSTFLLVPTGIYPVRG